MGIKAIVGQVKMSNAFLILITILSFLSPAQDEDYFKKILRGELTNSVKNAPDPDFETKDEFYHFDIVGDSRLEVIIPSKKDGVDWITIKNSVGETLFENKLQAYGVNSVLYKIRVTELKPGVKAIQFYFMEGVTDWVNYQRTARVYLLSYENGKFGYKLYKAAHISVEKEMYRNQYWRRRFVVEPTNLDGDDIKELMISYGQIQHVFFYKGDGVWKRF